MAFGDSQSRNASDIVFEFLQKREAGIEVCQEELIASHPHIGDQLRLEFLKLQELSDAVVNVGGMAGSTLPESEDSTRALIRCPHCNKPVDTDLSETSRLYACAECENEFTLVRDRKWPSQINHYELIDRIGMGGFGTVWKARDTELGRYVALKLPRQRHLDGAEVARFTKEARTAAKLNHPNIVRVYDSGTFDGEVYIASELIEGDSLSEHIGNGLPESEVVAIIGQLAQALSYAHEQGIVHRDLKPQNVLLDVAGKPYLSDFGLAGQAQVDVTLTSTGEVLGTPAYMSPEQARGASGDQRSDIYSFGVLLYEMLTGQLPFQGTLPDILRRLESEDPISPRRIYSRVSTDLDTICMKCLEKNPDQRYQSAQEVASELQRVKSGKPILSRPIGPLGRMSRWAKRNPVVATLAATTLFAIGCMGLLSSSLLVQRQVTAVQSKHTALEQIQGTLAEAKAGYKSRIFDVIREKPDLIEDAGFHNAVRDVAIRSMGDFAGYEPSRIDLTEVATVAISADGSLLAIAYKGTRIEVRSTSEITEVLYAIGGGDEELQYGDPIAVRFFGESTTELMTLRACGVLQRSSWAEGRIHTETLDRLRSFPVDESGERIGSLAAGAISLDGQRVALCDNESTVSIYDITDSELVFSEQVSNLGDAQFRNIAISNDHRFLATGYSDAAGSVGGVTRWDLSKQNSSISVSLNMGRLYQNGLNFDYSGERLGVGCEQTTQYEVGPMEIRQSFEGSESAALAYSPNGAYLVVCYISGEIEIRHRKSQAAIAQLAFANNAGRMGAAFSQEGNHLVVWNQTGLQVVDLSKGQERLELAGHRRGIPALRFAENGTTLISSSKSGLIKRWDATTGVLQSDISLGSQVQCVALDANEDFMATAKWGKDATLSIWSYPELTSVCDVPHDLGNICGLQFSPGNRFLAATGDYGLQVWEVSKAQDGLAFELYHSELTNREKGEKANGKFLIFDPQGKRLFHATAWWNLGCLDLSTRTAHPFPNERRLLMGFNSIDFTTDGNLAFINPHGGLEAWDFADMNAPRRKLQLPDDVFAVSTVSISKQGLFAGLTEGSTVAIWDLDKKKELYRFRPESNAVWSLAWSPDGDRIAVGLSDGGLAIWDLKAIRKQLETLGFDE